MSRTRGVNDHIWSKWIHGPSTVGAISIAAVRQKTVYKYILLEEKLLWYLNC
jgi:hypothetical protein